MLVGEAGRAVLVGEPVGISVAAGVGLGAGELVAVSANGVLLGGGVWVETSRAEVGLPAGEGPLVQDVIRNKKVKSAVFVFDIIPQRK